MQKHFLNTQTNVQFYYLHKKMCFIFVSKPFFSFENNEVSIDCRKNLPLGG